MNGMGCEELLQILSKGEDYNNQFKLNFDSVDKLAVEIAAFLNSSGGRIIVGVTNNGEIEGLTQGQIDRLNQWISNISRNNIYPSVSLKTQTLNCNERIVLIINVPKGDNKPYAVNKTDVWIKSGSDKRRATIDDIRRLLQESGRMYAEEEVVDLEVNTENLNLEYFEKWYETYYKSKLDFEDMKKLFNNWKLAEKNSFTLAGLLLFGKNPENIKPQFAVKAVYWQDSNLFKDKEEIYGNLIEQFKKSMDFVKRNLRKVQNENVNEPGRLEIPEEAVREAIANAIVHRDYFIESPIYIEIYNDKLEIISPGTLPNTLTEESIKAGIHRERNPILLSFLEKDKDFRYSGMGKGIPRIEELCGLANVKVEYINDKYNAKFIVRFYRSYME